MNLLLTPHPLLYMPDSGAAGHATDAGRALSKAYHC